MAGRGKGHGRAGSFNIGCGRRRSWHRRRRKKKNVAEATPDSPRSAAEIIVFFFQRIPSIQIPFFRL